MVTAAKIVGRKPNTNKYNVEIFAYGKYEEAENEEDLSATQEAIVAVCPGLSPAYKAGDIVYVCIEDNKLDTPVIMGALHTKNLKSLSDAKFSSLIVSGNTKLGEDTTIGSVTKDNIKSLIGVRGNIQNQIDANISTQISLLDDISSMLDNTFK